MTIHAKPSAVRSGACLAVLALVATAGCPGGPPAPADPDRAREVLQTTLDAWQKGEKPDSVRQGVSAVSVVDREWAGGWKLTKFQIEGDEAFGSDRRFKVVLSLTDPRGKSSQKKTSYTVAVSQGLTVVRDED